MRWIEMVMITAVLFGLTSMLKVVAQSLPSTGVYSLHPGMQREAALVSFSGWTVADTVLGGTRTHPVIRRVRYAPVTLPATGSAPVPGLLVLEFDDAGKVSAITWVGGKSSRRYDTFGPFAQFMRRLKSVDDTTFARLYDAIPTGLGAESVRASERLAFANVKFRPRYLGESHTLVWYHGGVGYQWRAKRAKLR